MRRVLATLVALSLVMSMFTGVFAPVPEARAAGPAPVVLGTAGNFVILAKTLISTTGTTDVTGDIGISPNAASFITGFALVAPPTTFTTSALVTGKVYAADYDPPTPTNMTTAVSDMETAYTAAAGVTAPAPVNELGAGDIGGMTITPGVYKWGTGVIIPTDVTLSGSANDVWIFQIAQTLTVSNGIHVKLSGGAQAANIFWQVAGQTILGTTSVFNGIILDLKAIVLNTGATLNGRALSQTAVTLDASTVVAPTSAGAVTGTIIVDKVTIPSGDPQLFEFDPSWSLTGFSLADATTPYNSGPLVPGTYSVAETIPTGWTQTSAVASDGSPVTALSLQAGETITVTFTNTLTSLTAGSGDVDGSGTVNTDDVLMTARAVVGLGTPLTGSALLAVDVNGDGFVNVLDVLLIARIAVH